MPYSGEYANKASHYDLIKNPEIAQFLGECDYLKPPSDEEGQVVSAHFAVPPTVNGLTLPERVIAIDGSYYEASIDEQLPSTKVGYVKVSSVLIDLAQFHSLRVGNGRLVDPFRVAELQKQNSPLTFSLPSANIRWKGKGSVRESFRASVDAHLSHLQTRFNEHDPATSLRTTLFHLASRRPGAMGTGNPGLLKIHQCPCCEKGPLELADVPQAQYCPWCQAEVYPADCLRLWEEVSDYQSNVVALSRFMLVVEHLLPFHYIRYLLENALSALGSIAFFLDGPLALFGTAAWLHSAIMDYLSMVNKRLMQAGLPRLLMIGLQKTGQVADHVNFIERFVPANRIYAIDDDYRYQYILMGREPANSGFGYETYYGQDFIYKTPSGRAFVFALPYPFASKREPFTDFIHAKTDLGLYSELAVALVLIQHFETDLYKNAVVPIALAHRYTAISLVPGGRVLDVLTRKALEVKP